MAQLSAAQNALVCTSDGIFILQGSALVERHGNVFIRTLHQEICNLAATLYGPEVVYGALFPTLERATRSHECGLFIQAQETIAKLSLPSLTA